jgi:Glutaredoxin-like domain (DUF836)
LAVTRLIGHLTYNLAAMSATPLPDLIVYSRPGCHLCEETTSLLDALLAERRDHGLPVPAFVHRDIETDPAWHEAYLTTIPVVELGGRRLELATSLGRLRRLLTDVLDGPADEPVDP